MDFKSRRPLRTEGLEPRMMFAADVLTLAESCEASLNGDEHTPIYMAGDANEDGRFDQLDMEGRTLYIMQNFSNKIAVVQRSDDLDQGTFVKNLASDQFAVPTTITGFGDSVYAINMHFCEITTFCGLEEPADPFTFRTEVVRVDSGDVI